MDVPIHCTEGYSDQILYVFSTIPRKLYTIFQPTFVPDQTLPGYILFKLLTLNTDSVTKNLTVVRTIYFYNSGSIFTTKNFVKESVLKVRLAL